MVHLIGPENAWADPDEWMWRLLPQKCDSPDYYVRYFAGDVTSVSTRNTLGDPFRPACVAMPGLIGAL